MAVMARMVGLPARYIEGYAAVPDSDSVARVTQQQAHAWVEIYFSGFGWLPFDPTPGIGRRGRHGIRLRRSGRAIRPRRPPRPTADTRRLPRFACAGRHRRTPRRHPLRPNRTAPPTPEPDAPLRYPVAQPRRQAMTSRRATRPSWLWPLLLLLLLLLLALLAALRLYLCAPAQVAGRQKNANDALLVWYRAAEDALLCMGIAPLPGEAPALVPLARARRAARRGETDRTGQGALRRAIQRPHAQAHPAGTRAEGLRRAFRANDPAAEAPALRAALTSVGFGCKMLAIPAVMRYNGDVYGF